MLEEVRVAYNYTEKLFREYAGVQTLPTEEEQKVLDKFLLAGVIQMTKRTKPNLGRDLYFPALEAEEFRGLSIELWLFMMRHFINKYNIPSNLGSASAADYLSRYWLYKINPTVVNKTSAGRLQIKEELAALKTLTEGE